LRYTVVFLAVLILPAIPFLLAGPLMPGLRDYATRWIFNSPLYDSAFAVIDSTQLAAHLKSLFTSIKDPLHLEPVAHFVYFHLYSDYLTRAFLGVLSIVLIAIAARRRAAAASVAALLLCSPAIHPWYWVVLVPLAMAEGAWIWMAIALCAPLSYLLYGGVSKWIVWPLCYVLPLTMRLRPSAIATSAAGSRAAAPPPRTARDTSPS
jgi:hypothetical protein